MNSKLPSLIKDVLADVPHRHLIRKDLLKLFAEALEEAAVCVWLLEPTRDEPADLY